MLLWLKISARMRNFAQNMTRSRFWQVPIYFILFFIAVTVATFPLTVYESFFREHAYGLSNQNFVQWFGDFATEFAITLIITDDPGGACLCRHSGHTAWVVVLGRGPDHILSWLP